MSSSKLFYEKFNKTYLTQYYNEKIAHKANPGIDRISRTLFEKNIDHYLEVICKKTGNGSYKFTCFMEKLISKGRGKSPRIISIPTIRDKITIGVLKEILTDTYSTQVSTKLTQNIIEDLKNELSNSHYDYFIKIDIRGFYDNIDQQILLNIIKKKIKKQEVLTLIQKAIENQTIAAGTKSPDNINRFGVPQGISISNILANIYLKDLDKKFSAYKNIAYFRYVDDILIICNKKNYIRINKSIKNELDSKLKLSLNEKQDEGEIKKGFDYLGYKYYLINKKVEQYGFGVKQKSISKLENSLFGIFAEYKKNTNSEIFIWNLNLRITGFIIDKHKYGWLFFYSQIDDISVLHKLDWFIKEMCKKFNVNVLLQKRIKKFVKAYYEIIKTRGNSKYIPKSREFSPVEIRQILDSIFGFSKETLDKLMDDEIIKIFRNKMYLSVQELEKDVQSLY